MSEFQEAHTVSTLKGAPPGYVGYGEGGILTEAVRRKPYSVVLLDEVEKAHSDVHEIFFQVFDKGVMEDGEGRVIDFKNTIILLTTNVGSDLIMNMCADPDLMPSVEGLQKALREPMLKVFPAALLGRMTVIPYFPLSDDMVREISKLQLGRIQKRISANHGRGVHIRRRRARSDREPVHRARIGRPDDRRDPDPDHAPRDLERLPDPHDGGRIDQRGEGGGRRRRVHVRLRVSL